MHGDEATGTILTCISQKLSKTWRDQKRVEVNLKADVRVKTSYGKFEVKEIGESRAKFEDRLMCDLVKRESVKGELREVRSKSAS